MSMQGITEANGPAHDERPQPRTSVSRGAVVLAFVHGVAVTILLVLFINADYEDRLYDQLVEEVLRPDMTNEEQVSALMHTTYSLLERRHALFEGLEYIDPRGSWFRSADLQLIDAKGACGSYTHVLGRLLQRAGFDIRIAQMKCGDVWGCHIVLEAHVDGSWVVLDPLHDLHFARPDGALASFDDVRNDWTYYVDQVPAGYDSSYAYEDVRYTNWRKIPVVMPAMKEVLRIVLGDEVETLSLRSYVLNLYKTYAVIGLMLYALFVVMSLRRIGVGARRQSGGRRGRR